MKNLDEVKNRIINVINMHEQFKNHVYIVGKNPLNQEIKENMFVIL